MSVAVPVICPVKLGEQRTTVLMLDSPFQAQLTIAIPQCVGKLGLKLG